MSPPSAEKVWAVSWSNCPGEYVVSRSGASDDGEAFFDWTMDPMRVPKFTREEAEALVAATPMPHTLIVVVHPSSEQDRVIRVLGEVQRYIRYVPLAVMRRNGVRYVRADDVLRFIDRLIELNQ